MRTITKRSGLKAEFRSDKILNSMRNAGVSEETAKKVAAGIIYREGMKTSDVRNQVVGGIKNKEPWPAKQYESHPKKAHTT